MLYILVIILTHLLSLVIIFRKRDVYRFELDMEKIFSTVSEYMATKSILRSRLSTDQRVDKEILFSNKPALIKEGIEVSSIPIENLGRRHLEDRINRVILDIDEHLGKLDIYGVLVTGAIIFPILLSALAIFFTGPVILSLTPLIQLFLLWVVSRWIRK